MQAQLMTKSEGDSFTAPHVVCQDTLPEDDLL